MSNSGGITSPEGVLMICIAVVLDIISFIPALNLASWILGIIILGLWLIFRTGGMGTMGGKIQEKFGKKAGGAMETAVKTEVKQAIKKGGMRFLLPVVGEFFPVVSAIPFWTWFVYKEMGGVNMQTETS